MDVESLLTLACGVEDDGVQVRVYLDSPHPRASLTRDRGTRSDLFHYFAGDDARAIRDFLARHRCWDVIRVPPEYTRQRGVAALKVAARWHSGRHSPVYLFAADRRVRDEDHRGQLRRAVGFVIASVLENPADEREYADLRLLAEVIESAPAGAELCTANEV